MKGLSMLGSSRFARGAVISVVAGSVLAGIVLSVTALPASGEPLPPGTPPVAASEVLPPATRAVGLPASAPLPPLVSAPVTAPASASGTLVDELPDVLVLVPHSSGTSSAVAPDDDRVQGALAARTTAGPAAVLAWYRSEFADYGLAPTSAVAVAGGATQAFYRGNDSVVVAVAAIPGGGSRYTVSGDFDSID